MSINKVFLTGNLTRSPELKQSANGNYVLNFGIAVNDRVRNARTGEWEDRPNYFDCVLFGQRAQSLMQILSKGMKISVEGKLHWSQWEKDGQYRSSVSITVDEVELMSQRKVCDHPQSADQGGTYADQYQYDADIPF